MSVSRTRVYKIRRNIDKSSWLFAVITLICGGMMIAGVFMPWFHIAKSVWIVNLSYSALGWEMAAGNSLPLEVFTYLSDKTFPQAYYVFSFGMLLIIISVLFLMIPTVIKKHRNTVLRTQGISAMIISLSSFGILMWFLCYILEFKDYLHDSDISVDSFGFGYGFYIASVFSLLALIVGVAIVAISFRKSRQVNKNDNPLIPKQREVV